MTAQLDSRAAALRPTLRREFAPDSGAAAVGGDGGPDEMAGAE
jgi:hypothetical protein